MPSCSSWLTYPKTVEITWGEWNAYKVLDYEGKRKKSGELVEILKESVKVTKNREDADREFKEREIRLREQQLKMQQQFQRSLLEQQHQFQVQQQAVTMAIVNT